MSTVAFLPFALGLMAILQSGLNRQIAIKWGLAGAVCFNNFIALLIGSAVLLVAKNSPKLLPQVFHLKAGFSEFNWWYLLPGIFGYSLVAGAALALQKVGAQKLFLGVVAAQLLGSVLWDLYVEKIPVNTIRIAGTAIALFGASLVVVKT